ncbi:MAG: gamma carbonic anhydrase family protein [Deferribacteraceae bacterium]|jgi:carbonic anhydrase/acetyltransferase-like protein (isoleucine patch superfamily)|nr:gamma carbonic anhydrase family protein [Deferribacteraceae bacterium]
MEKILQRLKKGPAIGKDVFIASNAAVFGDVTVKDNASIWYSCTLRGDVDRIELGYSSNIQDGSVVHTTKDKYPVIIGDFTTIAHGVCLHGCVIGNNVLVGIGAIILDNAVIGNNCIVAAGTLVPPGKVFPDGSFIMGHPAKTTRLLTEDDILMVRTNAEHYVNYKDLYLKHFK